MKLFFIPENAKPLLARRETTFDVAKGLAVLLMVMIHVLDFYGLPEVRFGIFGTVVKFALGWPAASMFVFIMGIFVGFSGTERFGVEIKRALMLFALGYALNLLRGTVPMWLSIQLGLVTYDDVAPHTPLTEFLIGDVFQFAGIALLICAVLKRLSDQVLVWIAFALVVTFSSNFVWDKYTTSAIFNEFWKLFIGDEDAGTMFPIFPWLAYPVLGMAFGRFVKQPHAATLDFLWCLKLGVVCVMLGVVLTLTNPDYHIVTNLRSGPGIVVLMTGIVLLFLYGIHLIVSRFKHTSVVTLLAFWGKYVTALYVVQWVLIGWGLMLVGLQQLSMLPTLLAMAIVLLLCHYLVLPWHQYSVGKKDNNRVSQSVVEEQNGPQASNT